MRSTNISLNESTLDKLVNGNSFDVFWVNSQNMGQIYDTNIIMFKLEKKLFTEWLTFSIVWKKLIYDNDKDDNINSSEALSLL